VASTLGQKLGRANPIIAVHKPSGKNVFIYDGFVYMQIDKYHPYYYNAALRVFWDPRDQSFYSEETLVEQGKV